jgi:hypothetical protein
MNLRYPSNRRLGGDQKAVWTLLWRRMPDKADLHLSDFVNRKPYCSDWAGRSEVRPPEGKIWDFLFTTPFQSGPGAHPASSAMSNRAPSGGVQANVAWRYHLPLLAQRLRMNWAIRTSTRPSVPIMAWYGKTFTLRCSDSKPRVSYDAPVYVSEAECRGNGLFGVTEP